MSEISSDAEAQLLISPAGAAPALRVAVVGLSVSPTCGVRAHARLLAAELSRQGAACSLNWLERREQSRRPALREVRRWARSLSSELERDRPDVVLLHYSIFDYCYRGLPLLVRPVLSALRGSPIPVIVFFHEIAYPLRYGGWRGNVWALTQRVALIGVMRTAACAIVSADFREQWLSSRRWLPRRQVAVAPVFSNLPAPRSGPPSDREHALLGLFGYSYQGIARALVLDALRLLGQEGADVHLLLLGAPGPSSSSAREWLEQAESRGLARALSFSGVLDPQPLSDAIAACDVLLFADASGPSSRKGSLAAALASGRPVVAIDGHRRWPELVESGAIGVVAPSAEELARTLGALLRDGHEREALGARGRAFAHERMGVSRTAQTLLELARASGRVPPR